MPVEPQRRDLGDLGLQRLSPAAGPERELEVGEAELDELVAARPQPKAPAPAAPAEEDVVDIQDQQRPLALLLRSCAQKRSPRETP